MIGPRNKALPAAISAVLLLTGPVWAQTGSAAASAAPRPLLAAPQVAPDAPSAGVRAVTVAPLGAVEGPPAGTLTGAQGLGPSVWAGAPKLEAEALLDRLPVSTTVGPVRALARRLLLTKAVAPLGDLPHAFLTVRLRRLLDGGLLADAGELAAVGIIRDDPGFDRARADALLYANQAKAVCGPDTARRNHSAEPFWVRLRAYCYAAAGDEAAVQLTEAVMQAEGQQDPAFDTLLANLHSERPRLPDHIEAADALTVFLLLQAGLPVPLDVGDVLGTPGLLLAARAQKNTPGDRLEAAERVVRTGALSIAELKAIADAQRFTPDQFATEHAQVLQMPFLEGQALLRQAVQRAAPDAQPALIYEALSTAATKNLMGIAAELEHDALMKLVPSGADREMTGLFARALMLTGETARAAQWAATLDPGLPSDAPLRARLDATLALMQPPGLPEAEVSGMLNELHRELVQNTPQQGFAALALGLYAVLKQPLPPAAAQAAELALQRSWPGYRPTPAYMRRLSQALHTPSQRGVALAFILDAIGAQGPGSLAPDVCVHLIGDLAEEGLASSARAIAVSALLGYQPPLPPDTRGRRAAGSASL